MRQLRTPNDPSVLDRARYFPGQVILPSDLAQDQDYQADRVRRHNRMLHGWGFVPIVGQTSLEVIAVNPAHPDYVSFAKGNPPPSDVNEAGKTWLVISPGYALAPVGDEIFVPSPIYVDTSRAWSDGTLLTAPSCCSSSQAGKANGPKNVTLALIVEACEDESSAVRLPGPNCGTHPDRFEPTRRRDTVCFRLVPTQQAVEPYDRPNTRLTGDVTRSWMCLGAVAFANDGTVSGVSTTKRDKEIDKPVVVVPPPQPPQPTRPFMGAPKQVLHRFNEMLRAGAVDDTLIGDWWPWAIRPALVPADAERRRCRPCTSYFLADLRTDFLNLPDGSLDCLKDFPLEKLKDFTPHDFVAAMRHHRIAKSEDVYYFGLLALALWHGKPVHPPTGWRLFWRAILAVVNWMLTPLYFVLEFLGIK